jgi:hypothetical protein
MKTVIASTFAILVGFTVPSGALAQSPSLVTSPPRTMTPAPIPPPTQMQTKPQPQPAYFPTSDQITGVWQGCGPANNAGNFDEFNSAHPRVRIVQVFIDASIPCKSPGAHTYVIVFQGAQAPARRAKAR